MNAPLDAEAQVALGALLDELIDGRGQVGWRAIDGDLTNQLTPDEAAIVSRAVPKRVAEFATGRVLLRTLLEADVEILRIPSGAPVLPDAFVGSLSHDVGIALGLVSSSASMRAVGIDVEPERTLDDGVIKIIVRPDDVVPDPITAFVAKEAAYKAWSGLGGRMLDHHDVQVRVDGGHYVADMSRELTLTGQIGSAAGRIVACVFIPAT